MRTLTLITLMLGLGLTHAQSSRTNDLPRGDHKQNSSTLRTSGIMRDATTGAARIETPDMELPADFAKGLAATNAVAYCVWVEQYGGAWNVKFKRSINGGYSWEKEQVIFVQYGTGTWDFEQFDIATSGHEVYVAMSTGGPGLNDRWPDMPYLIASDDQGQTWSQPMRLDNGQSTIDVDSIRCTAALGKCHVVYIRADASNNNDLNDLHYASAEFQNGQLVVTKQETRVNVHQPAPNTEGVAYFDISAVGPLVAIAYASPRVSSNRGNLYVATSRDFGKSLGNANTITKITPWTASNPRTDQYWELSVKCSGRNVYLLWGGNQAWPNNVYFAASNDLGQTFSQPAIVNTGGTGFDADYPVLDADGDTVAIAYHDDRDGNGNLSNSCYVVVDTKAGNDIIAGNHKEVRVDDPQPQVVRTEYPAITVKGENIVLVYEKSTYDPGTAQAEDLALRYSTDAGQTWSPIQYATKNGSFFKGAVDVNSPQVTMTNNDDVIVFWADNRASSADLMISGFKLPLLSYDKSTGFTMEGVAANGRLDLAVLLITEAGTNTVTPIDANGTNLNFVWGNFTGLFLGFPGYITTVPPTGATRFPSVFPAFGVFDVVAVGLDAGNSEFSFFTDPISGY